ncbi:hypothetical protein HD806DRAFT_536477 [Xylariaceae sp. AK1471]|nr:hypothetical protein HD806DRAFT_536477 [Xylariaceae sp. AK1471]
MTQFSDPAWKAKQMERVHAAMRALGLNPRSESRAELQREKDGEQVRQVLEENQARAKRFETIAAPLIKYGVLDVDVSEFEKYAALGPIIQAHEFRGLAEERRRIAEMLKAHAMPSLDDIAWLQDERAILQLLIDYTQIRDQLAVNYEQRYWDLADQSKAMNDRWAYVEGNFESWFAEGDYGPAQSKSSWTTCAYVKEMEKAKKDKFSFREKITHFINHVAGTMPTLCGVCYKCTAEARRKRQTIQCQMLYQQNYENAKVAYDQVVEKVGNQRIRWQAPVEIPCRPDTKTSQGMDAAAMYVWMNPNPGSIDPTDLGVYIHTESLEEEDEDTPGLLVTNARLPTTSIDRSPAC